jgi:hypothetical protein
LVVKKVLSEEKIQDSKRTLVSVVSMLAGLIKAVAPDRVYEESPNYIASLPQEQVKEKD